MSCIYNLFMNGKRNRSQEEIWNKILGISQKCTLACNYRREGRCTDPEYYEQFEVSDKVTACCRRGDGHLLNVTKEDLDMVSRIEKRRVRLPTGIRD